ncbi:long-chain fatty acid--CoA ligase [Cohnella endophytica]|uniref:Long-chain fatty acid--CoA ligase n=1 Tax=Cohnella endophytica TaxID=2419778 RepID=A0A494XV35_9BACL|nr:fatty acid--CoA ligase family protein [Cohnella endophytica]RKP54428.1 long-chain fatty acid--CoA ligase [Cohnella endophytica]
MSIQWLVERMRTYADREALIYGEQIITYRMLLEEYHTNQQCLKNAQIKSGEIVAIEGDYSPEVVGTVLALITNGNIIVPISRNVQHLKSNLLAIAEVQKCIDFNENFFRAYSLEQSVNHELLNDLIATSHAGLVLFSSGSTGKPKAILHDLDKLLEKFKTNRDTMRTMTFLLFDHIGGLNTLFHTLANGGTIICPKSRNQHDVCAAIESFKVELLPTTPSFLNLLLMTKKYKDYDLSSLKMITYGTEVMPESTLRRILDSMPNVELRQTYGLSELGILRAKSQNRGSLWVSVGGEGVETKIVDNLLYIKSETAMKGYLNAQDPFDKQGWFNTEDEVVTDGKFIRIIGRRSEIINVGGRKVYPAEVEEVLLQMPEIRDVIVKGQPNPWLGQVVAVIANVHEPLDLMELKQRIRLFCENKLESFQIPVYVSIQDIELFSDRFKKIRK